MFKNNCGPRIIFMKIIVHRYDNNSVQWLFAVEVFRISETFGAKIRAVVPRSLTWITNGNLCANRFSNSKAISTVPYWCHIYEQ